MRYIEPVIKAVIITPEVVTASQSYQLVIYIDEFERFLALYSGEMYAGEAEQ